MMLRRIGLHLQLLPQATLITGMESIAFAEAVGADLNYRTLKELRYALSAEMFNILAFLLLSWLQLQTVTGCL